jgi:glucose/arabinose dehydrogenase
MIKICYVNYQSQFLLQKSAYGDLAMKNSCYLSLIFTCIALALSNYSGAQEDYPEGRLVPSVDLQLQQVQVNIPAQFAENLPEDLTLNVPPGFSVSVFAVGLGLSNPRFMAFDDNNVLHVANMGRNQIVVLPDTDGDGVADQLIVAASGFDQAHSLTFYRGDLYVGDTHQVVRLRDVDGDLVYEEQEVLIDDIPAQAWHTNHTVVIDEINEKLYLGVGSPCDLCRSSSPVAGGSADPLPPNPEFGSILEFNLDGSGRRIFATGVRNPVGLTLHPVSNELWGNNNGHDLEGRTRPPEWIDIIRDNDFMGHPLVHSHQVWNDFGIERYQRMLPITPEDSLLAARHKRPVALVPAHYAPMGLHFYTDNQFPKQYMNAAFVAFRAGKAKLSSHPGYNVSALFSEPDGSDARMGEFITGFQTGTTQSSVWGFPVGLATDAEGSLYVGSNAGHNLILKVTHSPVSGSWQHNLPDILPVGQEEALEVQATVQVERLDAEGGAPRVTADLSELGGPNAVPLEAIDETTYRLVARLDLEDLPSGLYRLRVRLEQEIEGVTHTFDFFKTIALLPPDMNILNDALTSGWRMSAEQGAQVLGTTAAGPVFHGQMATAVQVDPINFFTFWSVELAPPQQVEPLGFAGLRFAFHPGDLESPIVPVLEVIVDGLAVDLVRRPAEYQIDLERREWQIVEVPFKAFDVINKYNRSQLRDFLKIVDSIRIEGNLSGTFYLDDVRLVTGIPAAPPIVPPPVTAVLEERSEALPGSFALEQNYPNPFNSQTVIGFSLSQAATVYLTVYNMSGQEVARLVYGRRQAGTYSVQWDGRDNADRELATGMYIYRLRAGDRVESRKLLLLR